MTARRHNATKTVAAGVVVLILVLLGLFWMRWLCSAGRARLLPWDARHVAIHLSPSQLEPGQSEDPNGMARYTVEARMSPEELLFGLGALQYVEARLPDFGQLPHIYRWDPKPDGLRVYYDASRGLIVHTGTEESRNEEGKRVLQHFTRYAGPEGIAETPDQKLGRFPAPIADGSVLRPQIVYDRALRRFFALDWSERTVRQGPQLSDDDRHRPIQIRLLQRSPFAIGTGINSTSLVDPDNKSLTSWHLLLKRVLVLDASGRIEFLDPQKLEFVGVAGELPTPPTLIESSRSDKLKDILAYDVTPFVLRPRGAFEEPRYAGLAAAALSRESLALRLDVYDPNGRYVAAGDTRIDRHVESSRRTPSKDWIPSTMAAYFHLPGAQVLTIAKLALESLHPPVLLLLSYLAGPHLEAAAGYRSLCLLPDSFVATIAREGNAPLLGRVFMAVVLAVPAILFVLLLAWRVDRHGARTGVAKKTRVAWRMGILLLGLPAYLTYYLTRPKLALVTCQNCGLHRRPDMEKCHRCGSPWVVPELTPPAWRVRDEGSPAALGWETERTQPGAAVP